MYTLTHVRTHLFKWVQLLHRAQVLKIVFGVADNKLFRKTVFFTTALFCATFKKPAAPARDLSLSLSLLACFKDGR